MSNDASPSGEAERLLSHPLLNELLDIQERDAIELSINTEDEGRRWQAVLTVRAIRELRRKLKTLAEGKTNPRKRTAVA